MPLRDGRQGRSELAAASGAGGGRPALDRLLNRIAVVGPVGIAGAARCL